MAEAGGAGVIVDNELESIRQKRKDFLKKKQEENVLALARGGGVLKDIDEPQFLPEVTGSKWAIVSFFHNNFNRCTILHTHMQKLAIKYPAIRFLKIDVEKAPFFVTKLQVRVLPAMLIFHNGVNTARIVGFEEFGNRDDFPTEMIEERMEREGMIILDSHTGDDDQPSKTSSSSSQQSSSSSYITKTQSDYEKLKAKMMESDENIDDDLF
ncbi:MAG: putative Thioredoxin domain [Streblomastix strix]|uniref:Putative Thioredoxin domain n=1 Tax=Streblomastix strix TaxID=222440 RepID=A0A5J4X9B3_9EUKA|nr:MAG: putative Thioredoxin domain [Streblomastix strix]